VEAVRVLDGREVRDGVDDVVVDAIVPHAEGVGGPLVCVCQCCAGTIGLPIAVTSDAVGQKQQLKIYNMQA
jgi:hypothetical protein